MRLSIPAVAALVVLSACSGSGDDSTSETSVAATTATSSATTVATTTASTAAPSTAAPTTAANASTTTSTTAATTTTIPSGPTAAQDAVQGFLDTADAVMADAAELWPIADGARATGAEALPEEGWPLADEINSNFYSLAEQVPLGLEPEVRDAAVKLIYDVGNHVAPYVFAPGFDFASWDPAWDQARGAGLDAFTADREALLAVAGEHGEVRDLTTQSQEAATDAVLDVVVVRSFGHNLESTPIPYAVRWLGALPAPSADSDLPYCPDVLFVGEQFSGSFVEGVGGCAIVYYDTTDPEAHEAELQAHLADPDNVGPPGEIVSVVWDADLGHYVVYGSWE